MKINQKFLCVLFLLIFICIGIANAEFTTINDPVGAPYINDSAFITGGPEYYIPLGTILSVNIYGSSNSATSGSLGVPTGGNPSNHWYTRDIGGGKGYTSSVFGYDVCNSGPCTISAVSGPAITYSGNIAYFNTSQITDLGIPYGINLKYQWGPGAYGWRSYRVGGPAPSPEVSFNASPSSGVKPLSVTFTDTSITYNTTINWYWSFGDGFTAFTKNTSHVYSTDGNYIVSMSIKDANNNTYTTNQTISVLNPSVYYVPINVIDISTGNNIFNSSLESDLYGSNAYHTWIGSYGTFNVTGTGTSGLNPINYGDKLYFEASAPNYISNGITKEIKIAGANMFGYTLPLAPNTLTPKSNEVTLAIDVFNDVTGAPLGNAYVVLSNPNKTLSGYTTTAGTIQFSNLSASDTNLISVSKSGFNDYSASVYAPTGGLIYKSIGLVSSVSIKYSVSYNPSSPTPNQNIQFSILSSGTDSTLSEIYYINCDIYNSNHELMNNKISTTYPYGFNFLKGNDNKWQYYDGSGYIGDLGTSTPNNYLFKLPTSGVFTLEWTFIDTSEKESTVSNSITVTGNVGQNTINVYPVSYLDSSFVSGAKVMIKDMSKNIWINKTVNSVEDCKFYLNTGYYNFNAGEILGYSDQMNDVRYISSSQAIQVVLYPEEISTDLDISTAYFNIEYEPNLYPLTGASVTVSNSSYTETKLSTQSGTVTFNLNNLTTYKISVSKTGYTTTSQFFTTNSRYYYLNVVVSPGSGVITYPPTTIITTFPTTPVYGINNTINGSVCGGNYSNIFDYFKGEIACWGVTGKESQNLLFGCIITIGAALIVGNKGKNGIGSVIGALIGFIVSIALGLFPFWILIAAIVLSGVILFAVFRKE